MNLEFDLVLNQAQNPAQDNRGFTLVELLVVMAIVGTLLSLVGPLAIDSLSKAQARTELLGLQTWLKYQSKKAYVTGQPIKLNFNGKQVFQSNLNNQTNILLRNFDYVFFQPQLVTVDTHGMASEDKLKANYSGKEVTISLSDWTIQNESN